LQLLLVAKGDDLKASTKLMKGFKAAALANKGKLVFVTVNAVSLTRLSSGTKNPVCHCLLQAPPSTCQCPTHC
jgi:hypothetical protein